MIHKDQEKQEELLIGSHVSFAKINPHNKLPYLFGALTETIEYGGNCFMIYTGPPQSSRRTPLSTINIDEFAKLALSQQFNCANIVIHAAYIFNCANPDPVKHKYAIDFLQLELERAEYLSAPILVLHPGNFLKSTVADGIKMCAATINSAFRQSSTKMIKIAIETMAGKGTEIGFKFEQLAEIISQVDQEFKKRVGICVDTCHIYDAGYDLKNNFAAVMNALDQHIGFENVLVFHINDSKFGLNSHRDRHANINKGHIMLPTLRKIINHQAFKHVMKILETP